MMTFFSFCSGCFLALSWAVQAAPTEVLTGRVATAADASMDALLAGKSGGAATMELFSAIDHETATYTRNPNLWCRELAPQLTGVAVYKSWGGVKESYGGVLITPHHLLVCKHAHTWAPGTWSVNPTDKRPSVYRFVTTDGTLVERHQIAQVEHPSLDLCLILLDPKDPQADTSGLHVMPIMRLDAKMVEMFRAGNLNPQIIAVSQGCGREDKVQPPVPKGNYPRNHKSMVYVLPWVPGSPQTAQDFRYALWSGDSGTPAFHLIHGKLYLNRILTMSSGAGVEVSSRIDALNQMIQDVDANAIQRGVLDAPTGLAVTAADPPRDHPVLAIGRVVPEPNTFLFVAGAAGMFLLRRRRARCAPLGRADLVGPATRVKSLS